jgi:hypothetical protein
VNVTSSKFLNIANGLCECYIEERRRYQIVYVNVTVTSKLEKYQIVNVKVTSKLEIYQIVYVNVMLKRGRDINLFM